MCTNKRIVSTCLNIVVCFICVVIPQNISIISMIRTDRNLLTLTSTTFLFFNTATLAACFDISNNQTKILLTNSNIFLQ